MDLEERVLRRRDGSTIPLTPRVFATLRFFVEHPQRILDKEVLMEAVWPDCIVEENNLAQNISTLRRAFADDAGAPRYIATVSGRGYRFLPEVRQCSNGAAREKAPEATSPVEPIAKAALPAAGRWLIYPRKDSSFRRFCWRRFCWFCWVSLFLFRSQPHVDAGRSAVSPCYRRSGNSREEHRCFAFAVPSAPIRENAFFAEGVQDDILTALAKGGRSQGRSRAPASVVPPPVRSVIFVKSRRRSGLATVLEGSVRRAGDRVRVTAQFDPHVVHRIYLLAQTYDRDPKHVFAHSDRDRAQQDRRTNCRPSFRRTRKPPSRSSLLMTSWLTISISERDCLMQMGFPASKGKESLLEAVRLLDQAVTREPEFFLAYCQLARTHDLLYFLRHRIAPLPASPPPTPPSLPQCVCGQNLARSISRWRGIVTMVTGITIRPARSSTWPNARSRTLPVFLN